MTDFALNKFALIRLRFIQIKLHIFVSVMLRPLYRCNTRVILSIGDSNMIK